MPSITLNPGDVNVTTTNTIDPSAINPGQGDPVWSDGTDGTYSETFTSYDSSINPASFSDSAVAPLDLLVLPSGATVTGMTFYLRAANVGTSSPLKLYASIQNASDTDWLIFADAGDFAMITDNHAITEYVHPVTSDDLGVMGNSLGSVASVLMTPGTKLRMAATALPGSGPYHCGVKVTNAYLVVDYTVSAGAPVLYTPPITLAPPLRQWPRSDGLTGGARRGWPPPKSQQFSSRRGGGYL